MLWTLARRLTAASILGLACGCAGGGTQSSSQNLVVTYDYFVDVATGKPYSKLLDVNGLRFVVQFPGHNPFDSFLYGSDLLAFVYFDTVGPPYSLHELRVELSHDGRELTFHYTSFLDEEAAYKERTAILKQTIPPRELALDQKAEALVGFAYAPSMLQEIETAVLDVKFHLEIGGSSESIYRKFYVKRIRRTEKYQTHPKYVERDAGHAVLVGPWWLDWPRSEDCGEPLSDMLAAVNRAASSDVKAAARLTGAGFLPRLRFDGLHFEGFFLHYDYESD